MVDLDAVRADLGSSRPKRRMRRHLPALVAELEAARRVCEMVAARRPDDSWIGVWDAIAVWRAVRDGKGGV